MSPQLHLSRGFESPQLPSGDFSGDFRSFQRSRRGSEGFESLQVRKRAKIASFCHFHPPVREEFFTKPGLKICNFFRVKSAIFASFCHFHLAVREDFFTKSDFEICDFFEAKTLLFASKNNFSPVFRRVPKVANTFDEAKTHYFEQFATVKTGFILNMRLTVTSE